MVKFEDPHTLKFIEEQVVLQTRVKGTVRYAREPGKEISDKEKASTCWDVHNPLIFYPRAFSPCTRAVGRVDVASVYCVPHPFLQTEDQLWLWSCLGCS